MDTVDLAFEAYLALMEELGMEEDLAAATASWAGEQVPAEA